MDQKIILVFVNPASGAGYAVREWNKAKPVFDTFKLNYKVIQTTHQNHCYEYLSQENLQNVSGIVLVSGDGLPHEAINALFNRPDWNVVSQIPIGVLPGGSANAFAKNISLQSGLANNSESCALIIAKGQTKMIDLMCFEIGDKKIASFLSLAWAFISDVDLNSEFLRFMGGMRFDVYGTYRALVQKNYLAIFNGRQMNLKYFMAQKQAYLSDTFLSGPGCKLDDGYIDVQYLESSWKGLVSLALKSYNGGHVRINTEGEISCTGPWKYEKVKEFTLEPLVNSPFSIDGERYEAKPLRGYVLPKSLKVFCQ